MFWNNIYSLTIDDLIGFWVGFDLNQNRLFEFQIRSDYTFYIYNCLSKIQFPLKGYNPIFISPNKSKNKCYLKLDGYISNGTDIYEIFQIIDSDFVLEIDNQKVWFKKSSH